MKKIQPYMSLFDAQANAEHFDTHEAIIAYVGNKYTQIEGFSPYWTDYTTKFDTENVEYNQSLAKPETEQLAILDNERDETYNSMLRCINYNTYSKEANVKATAELLKTVFNKYKYADKKGYTLNSGMITNLVEDLEEDAYTASLLLLGLDEDLTLLKTQNEAFKTLYRARSRQAYLDAQNKLGDARRATDLAFDQVAILLAATYNTKFITDPTSTLVTTVGDIIDAINSYLETASNNLARRVPSFRKGEGSGNIPGPPPTPPEGPPHIAIAEQTTSVPGQGPGVIRMSFKATDAARFRSIFDETVIGGIVRMVDEDGDPYDFPILEFLMSEDAEPVVIGLTTGQYRPGGFFEMPFVGVFDAPSKVMKDDTILAIFDGTSLPDMTHID